MSNKIPILVLAFNRADHVMEAMKSIREYKPDKLYLECDGPRGHKKGEKEAVEATRKAMLDAVNWPCEVKTLFREDNLGCAKAVYGAISWFFEHEEYGIICEDDIILGQDFYKLCELLLPRYKNEEKVMSISAQNLSHRRDIPNTYVYSIRQSCWGWASWARAWGKMDFTMSFVPKLSLFFYLQRFGLFESIYRFRRYKNAYQYIDSFSSWASRWFVSIIYHDGRVIVPGANLAINIGIDGGTHYAEGDVNPYADLTIGNLEWPLSYNDSLVIDKKQAKYDKQDFWRIRRIGLRKKVRRLFHIKD